MAIVRRGPGRERGVVMLNGSKVPVDVEELPEAEIKSLSKQKRVKPPRIPLDQPPVLGVIRRRHRNVNGESEESGADQPRPPSPTKAEGAGTSEGSRNSTWSSAVPRLRSPLGRYFMQAMEQAATSTQQAVAAISPPSSVNDSSAYPTSEFPMEHALNALQYLQALHSRSRSLAGTGTGTVSDGWALISEKGFPLYRKLVPEISTTLPVYKGEKVIEGISAEEIATVVTSYDARKRWDERFVGAHMLEAFAGAGGAHTAFAVSKASFPFRDRGFYLASILARGAGARESNSAGKDGAGGASSSSSVADGRSPPIFCVSASFPPELARTFTATKYNPYSLPIGRMLIDGWILETLDPYTTENYAIPSTRCTRVVAADYAGSLPAAVNAVTNTTLVKTLLSVEAYMKGIASSLPFARLPAAGVLLMDKRERERGGGEEEDPQHQHQHNAGGVWTLRRRDESRELVQTRWTPDDRVYRGVMLLTVPAEPVPGAAASTTSPLSPSVSLKLDQAKTVVAPNPSGSVGNVAPASSAISSSSTSSSTSESTGSSSSSSPCSSTLTARPHSRSLSSSSTTTPMRRRMTSAAVVVGGRSPSSERSLRVTSSAFTVRGEVRQAADLLVAEVVVDSKLYPEGYHVRLRSRPHDSSKPISLLPAATPPATTGDGTTSTIQSEITESSCFLPLTYTVHTLPSSPLHSSGLAVDHPPRHLLRLALPTAQTQISTLLDPLTGETRAPPPKPQWMLELCEKGAVIEVEIRPATQSLAVGGGKKARGGGVTVVIDGVAVDVEGEKESLTSVGREELQDDRVAWMAVLSRCVRCMRGCHIFLMRFGADETRRCGVPPLGVRLLSRHPNESARDGLPTELCSASAVANFLVEASAISEEAVDPKIEEREQSVGGKDKEGNEETSSKARTEPIPFLGGSP